jgi:ankyrin repeat protein
MDPKTGHTILHNYCKYINTTPLEVYRYLIETKGCDVNVQDDDNDTPFHYAIRCFDPNDGGNITVLTYLLAQTNINVNTKGYNGNTLLHYACFEINTLTIDIFKLLIERLGAGVNAQDDYKHTPIHIALGLFNSNNGGDIAVLTYLLMHDDVNTNIHGQFGATLLHFACSFVNDLPLDVFKYLIEKKGCVMNPGDKDKLPPLCSAFIYLKPDNRDVIHVLSYLINQALINVNFANQNSYTPLHFACIRDFHQLNQYLWRPRDPLIKDQTEAEIDTTWSQIVEIIVQSYSQQVFDEATI